MGKTAVILGMHRAGTSLVASMLEAMGVDMGPAQMRAAASQPWGHYEDLGFVNVNDGILAEGGGQWDEPPAEIDWQRMRPEVVMLVQSRKTPEHFGGEPRQGEWWGWKDPRTCLTAPCYHQYLEQPHYIAVDRDTAAIVKSLEWRNGKEAPGYWESLIARYERKRAWFLANVQAPTLHLQFEDLLNEDTRAAECQRLAEFLGMDAEAAEKAAAMVQEPASGKGLTLQGDEWEKDYGTIAGQLDWLTILPGADPANVRGWLGSVKPGGKVYCNGGFSHDWPATAWEGDSDAYTLHTRKPYLKRGDTFGTIGLGVPYLKADYSFFKWWSHLLRDGLEPGDVLLNDDSVKAPLPIPFVHNRLMARFLETDRDTLVIVEDDHSGAVDLIRQMREKPENQAFDIVCANYVNRRDSPAIVGYGLHGPNRHGEYTCYLNWPGVDAAGTQEVDGAAMGLVFIRRWVLEAIRDGRHPIRAEWCKMIGHNSQDIQFYAQAGAVGARSGVDRDAELLHTMSRQRSPQEFWELPVMEQKKAFERAIAGGASEHN